MYSQHVHSTFVSFFFFNDTATTEIYTLSLHDALPISRQLHPPDAAAHRRGDAAHQPVEAGQAAGAARADDVLVPVGRRRLDLDRKSTRLNSSHANISYAVFCLKKKKQTLSM